MPMYQTLLAKLARALDAARIPYMVIGGQAVLLHGEPRLTRDIDVTVGVDAGELKRVMKAVAEAIARVVTVVFDRVPVRFAAVEDLVIHKLVAGRPRDIEDIAGVLRRRPTLDLEYLHKWLTSFREVLNRDLASDFKSIQESLSGTNLR